MSDEGVEWLRGADVLAQLGAEWDELAVRQANPFMRRDWLTAWWSAFGRGREAVLCIARRNGKLVAGIPLSSGRRGLATLANDHTPLVIPLAADSSALAALARAVAAADVESLRLIALPRNHPVTAALVRAARDAGRLAAFESEYVSPITVTTSPFEEYRALRKERWRDLERRMRNASRDRRMAFRLIERPVGGTAFLEAGLIVEASGWKGRGHTAILSAPETAEFYRAVARAFAQDEELALSGLWFDDLLVAFDLALVHGNRYWLLKTGYDESVRTLAPGLILRRAIIERCFELSFEAHEFLGGDVPWKRLFSTDERAHCACRAYRRQPLGIAQWTWRRARPRLRDVYRRVQARREGRP
jgi:CelD/BcsL family acetyltransferase involved in cellulose biosynthesis